MQGKQVKHSPLCYDLDMRDDISKQLADVSTVIEVEKSILKLLRKRHAEHKRVGYVSGIITSDGPGKIAENSRKLYEHTENLRKKYDFPIFACTDIFTDEIFSKTSANNLTAVEWMAFWRNILNAGYITDVFMTPRWRESAGAKDEYETTRKLRLKIHYIDG